MTSPETADRRRIKGEQTRQAILQVAVNIASVEGLEGLSIGRLAAELQMSKSGLFAHFGSKEELQLATIEAASAIFTTHVKRPVYKTKVGLLRLWDLCDRWLTYMEQRVFPGGCFFAAASVEFDSRPGQIRDRLAAVMQNWLSFLARLIKQAQAQGELMSTLDADQLAFEIHALVWSANWMFQLYDDPQALTRARTAILQRLRSATTATAPELPFFLVRSVETDNR